MSGVHPAPSANFWRTFREVDSHDAGAMVEWLDYIATLPPVGAAKEQALRLLAVSPGDRVLDVGCGTGHEVAALGALVGSMGSVTGLDNSAALIAAARRRATGAGGSVEFVLGDAHTLPFPNEHFNAVRADRTLQHLAEPERGLREMVRVLRPGGRIVVTEGQWSLEAPSLDGGVTRSVVDQLFGADDRRAWVGHLLPFMYRMVGLMHAELVSHTAEIRDPESLRRVLKLDWATERLIERGELSQAAADRWLEELYASIASGEACGKLVLVHLGAVKPA